MLLRRSPWSSTISKEVAQDMMPIPTTSPADFIPQSPALRLRSSVLIQPLTFVWQSCATRAFTRANVRCRKVYCLVRWPIASESLWMSGKAAGDRRIKSCQIHRHTTVPAEDFSLRGVLYHCLLHTGWICARIWLPEVPVLPSKRFETGFARKFHPELHSLFGLGNGSRQTRPFSQKCRFEL